MFLREGELVRGVRGDAEFAVDFVVVGVGDEAFDEGVCGVDGVDGIGVEKGREALLPIVVAALDFAFCLRRRGKAEGDAVEVQSVSELGKSVRFMGIKDGVEIDVEGKRKAVSAEGAGEEIEMRGEGFGVVNTGAGIEASGVVDDVEKGIFTGVSGEPSVRSGIVLPKSAEVADLPSADGFGGLFITSIRCELVSDSPSADGGTIGGKIHPAQKLAGHGAVGRRRGRRKKTRGQRDDISGPNRLMIPARTARSPRVRPPLSAGPKVVGAKLVNASKTQPEFRCERGGAKLAGP